MKSIIKTAAAALIGLSVMGFTAASADHRDRDRDRDHDRYDRRGDDHRYDDDRYDDRRGSYKRDRHRRHERRYSHNRPHHCAIDHDHRYHSRDYYRYYPKDRYYRADPEFSISLSFGNGGYYDRGGRYYDRRYYDRRGYRNAGRVINRDVYRIRGYRADAILVEEVYPGRRGRNRVCTVTARGPDARYVPHGQLRRIAARGCSRYADIRVYA
ncbi:MAG: hypothetical protein KDD85_12785 [Parvularculaceae bacterium]|nr:hypothetical protein [Parvularculaceae bacterium]